MVGESGTILHTTDGGTTWTTQISGTKESLMGVCFIDADRGTVVGNGGIILRTTDGGEHWALQASGTKNTLLSVSFTDTKTGTAVGVQGTILHTTNGGTNWIRHAGATNNHLYGVHFTDANTGTAVGEGGTILRTSTGGVTWIEDSKPVPKQINLAQNYPNPFTSSTSIPVTLTRSDFVSLRIYNLFGQQVAVLLDERMKEGTHTVMWDGSEMPRGAYVCVLRTGSNTETRKIVLVNSMNR